MAPLFQLNRVALSRFNYHWLWGLRYNAVVQTNNLTARFAELRADNAVLCELWIQQASVNQYHFIVHVFYRLFNLDNYALNTYILVAYEAYVAHQSSVDKEINMPFILQREEGGLNWLDWARHRMYHFCNFNGLFRSSDHIANDNGVNAETDSDTSEDPGDRTWTVREAVAPIHQSDDIQLTVRSNMQPFLSLLDLNINTGALLNLSDVRVAYRRKVLLAHPDRGGSNERFHAVQNALEQLKCLGRSELSSQIVSDNQFADYFTDMMNEINLSLDSCDRNLASCDINLASCDRQAADIENRLTRLERINNLAERVQFTQSPNSSITCVDSHNSDQEKNPSIMARSPF